MKNLLAALLVALPLMGSAQNLPHYNRPKATPDPAVWRVTRPAAGTYAPNVGVRYRSLSQQIEATRQEGAAKLWPAEQLRARLQIDSVTCAGGVVLVSVGAVAARVADLTGWAVVVQAPGGQEVARQEPAPGAANQPQAVSVATPLGMVTGYNNLLTVPLPTPTPADTRVFVVDGQRQRHEFIIRPQ